MELDGFLLARIFGSWLFGFSALISIINPLGIAFVFQEMTRNLPADSRTALARTVARNSFILLVVSMFLGSRVLAFFGISLDALRIAGGLVVATTGWSMLVAEPVADDAAEPRKATLSVVTVTRRAFFPLTMPLTIGPGSIATAVALNADRPASADGYVLAAVTAVLTSATVAALIWLAYRNAEAIARRLGPEGSLAATKLSAFLLMCVGVQIVLTGLSDALQRIFPAS